MTGPAPLTAPPPGVTGWIVSVPMPRFPDGRNAGELVGWLTTNNTPTTVRQNIQRNKISRLWRQAAELQYRQCKIQRNVGRVYVTVAFATTARSRLRDSPNLEPTVKPIIDALQPDRRVPYWAKNRHGDRELKIQHHIGWGVVPDDNDRWVIRGPQQPWLPKVPDTVGGLVVVNIIPFPEQTPLHQA